MAGLIPKQGLPIEKSERGNSGMAVFVQDQTTSLLDIPFLQPISSSNTVTTDTAIGNYTVQSTAHTLSVGNVVEMANGSGRFYQGEILSVGVNDFTLDTPINRVYASGTIIYESNDDILVNGSVTPVVFSVFPLPTQKGDIVRIIVTLTSSAAQDFETFGSAATLTNGCVLRVKREDGSFENIFNWKNNGELIERTFDHQYQTNNGGSVRSFVARRTFGGQSKNGVVIRLDGSIGEELQVVIQDDLTGTTNTTFKMYAQGHEIQS